MTITCALCEAGTVLAVCLCLCVSVCVCVFLSVHTKTENRDSEIDVTLQDYVLQWTLEVIRFCWHLTLSFDLESCLGISTQQALCERHRLIQQML